jgi:hypothetical protein
MTTKLKANLAFVRCGLCYHWTVTEESEEFVVFRDGVEEKIMFGCCSLKGSEPDSECVCGCFEERVENLDDEEVQLFSKAADDAHDALVHFRTTGDRSKFKEWIEKYKDLKIGDKNGL